MTSQCQLNNRLDVTRRITVPLRNHLYLCEEHERHLNTFTPEVICFQPLPQNCCIALTVFG